MADWDFSGYVLDSVRVDEYQMNWKTFVETYLEVYHVNPFHPGLGNFTDCENFTVDYGEEYSIKSSPPRRRPRAPGTPIYRAGTRPASSSSMAARRSTARCGRATYPASPSSGIRTC